MRNPDWKDVRWFRPDGHEMDEGDWNNIETKCLQMLLAGDAIDELDERGNVTRDDTMLVLLNAHYEAMPFTLPVFRNEGKWQLVLDTRTSSGRRRPRELPTGETYELIDRSMAIFRFKGVEDEED